MKIKGLSPLIDFLPTQTFSFVAAYLVHWWYDSKSQRFSPRALNSRTDSSQLTNPFRYSCRSIDLVDSDSSYLVGYHTVSFWKWGISAVPRGLSQWCTSCSSHTGCRTWRGSPSRSRGSHPCWDDTGERPIRSRHIMMDQAHYGHSLFICQCFTVKIKLGRHCTIALKV